MPTYAVGDLQGCLTEFDQLLELMNFGSGDRLWLVGDLINRGPESLLTLERVVAMGDQVVTVLGNHDLHFLAIYYGGHVPSGKDTFDELLASPKIGELAEWLRDQKLAHVDSDLGYVMTHAGIPHIWGVEETMMRAAEVEAVLKGRGDISYEAYFQALYGNDPDLWADDLSGMPRLRAITNYLTRMRLVDEVGRLDFAHKGTPDDIPAGWLPWFERPRGRDHQIIFGHWAALDGHTGGTETVALDTGCVWGRKMTGFCLETKATYAVSAERVYS